MNKTTIIIPILEVNENNKEFFKSCIEAINVQKDKNFYVQIVTPNLSDEIKEITSGVDAETFLPTLINEGKTDYQSQINFAAGYISTEYFTVLQMDDIIFPNFIENVNKYAEAYPEIDCFTPLVYEVDPNDDFFGFSNETVWAPNGMAKFGYFDIEKTKEKSFYNFNLNFFTIKKEAFENVGKLKSLKKFGEYEFLLRLLHKGKKVYVIPKLACKHYNGLKGSIHDLQKDMDELEKKFWYNMSKKEYFFDYDREITYP